MAQNSIDTLIELKRTYSSLFCRHQCNRAILNEDSYKTKLKIFNQQKLIRDFEDLNKRNITGDLGIFSNEPKTGSGN